MASRFPPETHGGEMIDLKIEHVLSMEGNKVAIIATFDQALISSQMATVVAREIAQQIATRYVAENFDRIMATISPEAIANLSIAEAAAAIRVTLEKKIPDKILEITKTHTEVYQRGILGGMKRVL